VDWWPLRYNWVKYGLIALAIHGVILILPLAHKAPQAVKERLIDIVVMRREAPASPAPRIAEQPKPVPKRLVVKEAVPRAKEQIPAPQPVQPAEKKAEPTAAGAGNVLDEQIASQVLPAPGPDSGEGVGIAGVNVAGGRVGLGGGGTGIGIGTGGNGSGTVTGKGGGAGQAELVRLREPPKFAHYEEPEYPLRARRLGKEGKVVLDLTIDEKGSVVKADAIEATDQMFVAASVSAAKRWKFVPHKRDGVPAACRAQLTLPFRMQD
jgi:periplasmic protein TonB